MATYRTNSVSDSPVVEYRKFVDGRCIDKFEVDISQADRVDGVLYEIGYHRTSHGNSRKVVVCGDVDEKTYARRVERCRARPICQEVFSSAREASSHMGYDYNEVAQALNRAEERGERVAVVAGVPFSWLDQMPGSE